MNTNLALALAFGIGVVTGLRSMTAPAVVCWAAHLGWVNLEGSRLAFMGSVPAVAIFTLAAIGELVADKLPRMGKRTAPGPLAGRMILGGLCGAAICIAGGQSVIFGAVLAGVGGIVGAFVGYETRTGLVKKLRVADAAIAVPEDLIAIGAGLFLVSRF